MLKGAMHQVHRVVFFAGKPRSYKDSAIPVGASGATIRLAREGVIKFNAA
jgi:hypothetical protein